MKIKTLLFSILLLFFHAVFSQKNSDDFLLKQIFKHRNSNTDSLIFYAKKLQGSSVLCNRVEGIIHEVFAYHTLKKFNLAEKTAIAGIKKIEKNEINPCLQNKKINLLNRLFWAKRSQEDYNQALSYLVMLEKENQSPILKGTKTHFGTKISSEMSKALIKKELKMEEDAKEILIKLSHEIEDRKYENVFTENNLFLQKAHILNSLGDSYLSLSYKKENPTFLDSAQINFDKAYAFSKQLKPVNKNSHIFYTIRKVKVLIAKKEYENAIKLINGYKDISNGYNYHSQKYFQKAVCFYNLKKTDSAYFNAYKCLENRDTNKPSVLIALHDILSNQYYNEKKLDSAYKYSQLTLKEYNVAKDNKQETYQLLYKNDFNKAKNFNSLIVKQESQKRKSSILMLLAVGIILIVLLAYYRLFRKNKKVNEEYNKIVTSNTSTTNKVDYNIDEKLEKEIISTINRMEENLEFLKPDFGINYIAEKIKTNPTYISYIFNKTKQETFKQHYIKKRITYLTDKLKTDKKYRKYSVQALAEEIGYSNASSFARKFKQEVGISPSNFIKSLDD